MRGLLLVVVAACGGGAKPTAAPSNQAPPPSQPEPPPEVAGPPVCPEPVKGPCAIKVMEYYSVAMCKCGDKPCAEHVNESFMSWAQQMAKTASRDDKPDPDLAKHSADVMTRYTECMTRLYMAAGGQDDPPPPDDPCGD